MGYLCIGNILRNVGFYGDILDFFKYLPIMIIFMGLQEIGWRKIVQPHFEEKRLLTIAVLESFIASRLNNKKFNT